MSPEDRGGNLFVWILTAVVVVLLLAMLAGGAFLIQTRARIVTARTEVASLAAGVRMYLRDHGSVPATGIGLTALLAKPYVTSVPADPWGNPYVYTVTPTGFDLYSLGPDGLPGTSDDVR